MADIKTLAEKLRKLTYKMPNSADCEPIESAMFKIARQLDALAKAHQAEVTRLTRENEGLAKDAARYRWLRASANEDGPHVYGPDDDCIIDGDALDASIDAALAGASGAQEGERT